MKKLLRLLLVVLSQTPFASHAEFADNFSLVTQYDILHGQSRGAQPFQTGIETFQLTDVSIFGAKLNPSQPIALRIYDDFNLSPNSPVSTIFTGTAGAAGFNDNLGIFIPSVFSNLSITLSPQTRYWLVLENQSSSDLWFGLTAVQGSAPAQGTGYLPGSKLSLGLTGSFNLNNSRDYGVRIGAIPEPSSAVLILAAAPLLFRRRSR